MGSPLASVMAAMQYIEQDVDEFLNRKTKFAIDLAPGDVIKVGHRTIFLVGVNLYELDNSSTRDCGFSIQAAGAEAWYQSNDWTWAASEIMYDSPFLRFHPSQEITIERVSPSGTNTLDQLLAMREKLHKEQEEKKRRWEDGAKKAKESSKDLEAWAWGASEWGASRGYDSTINKTKGDDEGENPDEDKDPVDDE